MTQVLKKFGLGIYVLLRWPIMYHNLHFEKYALLREGHACNEGSDHHEVRDHEET